MGHETIVHGYIEGSTFKTDDYRALQTKNIAILEELPVQDEYPFLTRGMFSTPGQNYDEGTHRVQVIHFGGSIKGLESGDELLWVKKLEKLLKKMYWFSAKAYIVTEIDGEYIYSWAVDGEIISSYSGEAPLPTSKWELKVQHDGKTIERI